MVIIRRVAAVMVEAAVAAVATVVADPGPNPSLNADVPRAGLRPRSGPPVS